MDRKLTNKEIAEEIKRLLENNLLERIFHTIDNKVPADITSRVLSRIFYLYQKVNGDITQEWNRLICDKNYNKASELLTTDILKFAKVVHMMSSLDGAPFGYIMKEMPDLVIGTIVNNVPKRILVCEKSLYRLIPIDEAKSNTSIVYSTSSNTNDLLAFVSTNKYIINELEDGEQLMILKGKLI